MSKTWTQFECESCAERRASSRNIEMNFEFSPEVRQHALDRDLLAKPFEAVALGAKHLGHAAGLELLDDAVPLRDLRRRPRRSSRLARHTSRLAHRPRMISLRLRIAWSIASA